MIALAGLAQNAPDHSANRPALLRPKVGRGKLPALRGKRSRETKEVVIAGDHDSPFVQSLAQRYVVVRPLLFSLLSRHHVHAPRPQALHDRKRNVNVSVAVQPHLAARYADRSVSKCDSFLRKPSTASCSRRAACSISAL